MEAIIGNTPPIVMSQDVPDGECDGSFISLSDTTERPVVDVEHTHRIVAVTVLPKHDEGILIIVFSGDGAGWQIKLLESGFDAVLCFSVLANDVEMHAFHHDVGVIDEARERPWDHLFLRVDVCGVDLDNERGV